LYVFISTGLSTSRSSILVHPGAGGVGPVGRSSIEYVGFKNCFKEFNIPPN
jgi:hypothetical protein